MRHRMGNSPKCCECRWYQERRPNDGCRYDGWCYCKKQLSSGVNGHKREHPPEREPVRWNWDCRWWEDAEYPHINHFEAATRKPDPNRSPMEQMIIADAIAKAEEEQKHDRRRD